LAKAPASLGDHDTIPLDFGQHPACPPALWKATDRAATVGACNGRLPVRASRLCAG
jgi:hypothetical protein